MEATVREKEKEEEKGTIRLVSLYLQKEEVFEVLTLFLKAQQTVKFEFPTIPTVGTNSKPSVCYKLN